MTLALLLTTACRMNTGAAASAARSATVTVAAGQTVRFIGAWKLVRQEGQNLRTGQAVASATSDAWPGLLVYTPDGWMSVTIDRRTTGGSYWGYFGTFSVAGDTIIHAIVGGVPSGRGPSPALYRFANEGHRLVISTLPSTEGVVVTYSFDRAR